MPVIRIVLAVVWAVLWCVSLALPVASMGPVVEDGYSGLAVLMWGWVGVLGLQFAWLANFTLPGVAMLSLMKAAPVFLRVSAAVLQIGMAIQALFWNWLADEGGSHSIESYGPGYYLWIGIMIGSAVVLLIVTWIDRRRKPAAA